MEEQSKNQEKIDAFLLGHLSEKETLNFKNEIKMDESLAAEVNKRRRLIDAMSVSAHREMKSTLKGIHQEVIGDAGKVRRINWRPWLIAASAAIASLMLWWLASPQIHTPDQLFAQHYEPFPLSLNVRDAVPDQRIAALTEAYRAKDYQKAIPLLETLRQEDPNNPQLLLGLATAYFETDNAAQSFPLLEQIIATNDPFLSDEARWYSALLYIKQNDLEAARPFLDQLASRPRADHHEAAQQLLKQLK